MSERIPRSVTYSAQFDLDARKLAKHTDRAEEILRGIEWTFARSIVTGPVRATAQLPRGGPLIVITGEVGELMVEIEKIEIRS